jgi:CheY-like chemotaxis protein
VVTDLQMPVMDGLELMSKIKKLSKDTPVVIVTGLLAERVEKTDGIKAAAAVLYKPFRLEQLKKSLTRLLAS